MTRFASEIKDCRVCAAIRDCKHSVLMVGVFSFFENLLMLAAPLYMLQVYDRVLTSQSLPTLVSLTLVTLTALAALSLLHVARGRLTAAAADWLERRLSPGLFERAVQARLRSSPYGPEALDDLATVSGFATSPGMSAFFDLPWTLVFIAVAYMLHPWFGHLAVASAILLFVIALTGERLSREPVVRAREAAMIARRRLADTSRNAEVIEAMGMMEPIRQRWAGINAQKLQLQAQAQSRAGSFAGLTRFIRLSAQTATLGVGAFLVIGAEATGGVMIAASIILTRALGPIEMTIGAWRQVVATRAALQRLKAFALEREYRPVAMTLPAPAGRLAAEKLVFRLPDGHSEPVLKGLDFAVEPGSSLAVIGPSGAGKSTLARLLVGALPPFAGVVRLDGADIFSWDRSRIGDYLGYLPQGVELFAGTVAENIARMCEVDPDKVVTAARLVGIHEMILKLPQGYETQIGAEGAYLSGGQRQQVGLARAMYGMPALIVLDEPNSNLDGAGDAALDRAVRAATQAGSTVVIITHKMNLVQNMSHVLMLRNGLVEAFGERQAVLAKLMQPRQVAPMPQPQPAKAPVAKVETVTPTPPQFRSRRVS
ncbi:type I secretion system ABC transporter, PrtD family [Marinovum algicola DG 898]|nr:type I secretion system ABC transporter, PrtD family [Marinovum algicola DG 898]